MAMVFVFLQVKISKEEVETEIILLPCVMRQYVTVTVTVLRTMIVYYMKRHSHSPTTRGPAALKDAMSRMHFCKSCGFETRIFSPFCRD